MTDIADAQTTMAQPEARTYLTLERFLKGIADFPKDAIMVGAVQGVNLTIPIVEAFVVGSVEGKKLAVIVFDMVGTNAAMMHGNNMAEQAALANAVQDGAVAN